MQLSRPDPQGIARNAAWVPTEDPARTRALDPAKVFDAGRNWTATGLLALGHQLSVNLPTGGLVVSMADLEMPYHALPFAVTRTFDAQEQYTQAAYLDRNPNTNPRVHLFGNWRFAREVTLAATWNHTTPEILVSDGTGASALYCRTYPDFDVHTSDEAAARDRLCAYGVPARTLAALGWSYATGDALLRSRRGAFSLLSGSLEAETMVDAANVRLWRFDPVTGGGARYSSDYAYQQLIDADGRRETTAQALVTNVVDALGHAVAFAPVEAAPPYRAYRLTDGAGRSYRLDLDDDVTYLDGEQPGAEVKTYVVSRAADETKTGVVGATYAYAAGRLASVTYPGHAGGPARVYRYAYDDRGRLTSIADPVGDAFTIEYVEDLLDADDTLAPRSKVSRLTDGGGNAAIYTYDHPNRTVTVEFRGADGDHRSAVYAYVEDEDDTRQRFVTSEHITVTRGLPAPQEVHTAWQYSDDGRYTLDGVVDPVGATTAFTYNDFNQVTAKTDASGHQRSFEYAAVPAPAAATPNHYDLVRVSETNVDAAGHAIPLESRWAYAPYDATTSADAADAAHSTHREATHTNELGHVFTFAYDDSGSFAPLRATAYTDPLGHTATRAYDATGRLLLDEDATGNRWRWTYNARGQVVADADPNGCSWSWVYDGASDWLTARTDALGASAGDPAHSTRYEWTDAGHLSAEQDAAGARTQYAYAANQRLHALTRFDPVPRAYTFAYDAAGGLTGLTDPRGHTTHFEFDEVGRAFATYLDALTGRAIRVRFDAAGRALTVTERDGMQTQYAYDLLGRVTSVDEPAWPAGSAANAGKHVTFAYDRLGRRLRVTDSDFGRPDVYVYDAAGNLTRRSNHFGPALAFEYDARNALARVHDTAGAIDLAFTRDAAGYLASVTDAAWHDPSRTFRYVRQDGSLTGQLYRIDGPATLVSRFGYDPNRRLTSLAHEIGGAAAATYGYTRRADGRIGAATGDHVATYGYDGMRRLVAESDAGVRDGYDGAGNRLWRAAASPGAGGEDVFDAGNHLLQSPASGATYQYDGRGNLVQRGGAGTPAQYTYDGANRLRRVESGGVTVDYTYDVDDRLLERVRTHGAASETSRYVHGDGGVLAALDHANAVGELYTRDDVGRLLRRRSRHALAPAPSADPHSLFDLVDGLDNVIALVDWDGRAHFSASYDAWGEATRHGAAALGGFGYRRAYEDPDTRLLLFGHRWYDPALGRWIAEDPLLAALLTQRADVLTAGSALENLYRYVDDDPLNRIDRTGLGWRSWLAARLLAAAMKGRDIDKARFRPKGTATEQVERKAPKDDQASQEEDHPTHESDGQDESGGSKSTSSKMVVAGGAAVASVGAGVIAWEVGKWALAILAAPESGGTSVAAAALSP